MSCLKYRGVKTIRLQTNIKEAKKHFKNIMKHFNSLHTLSASFNSSHLSHLSAVKLK